MAQPIRVVSILLCESKPVRGLFCLHLKTIGWSGHVTSTIWGDNLLGFKSLWLEFRISAYGQDLVVQCLALGYSPKFLQCSGLQTVVRVPLVVHESFQDGARIGLVFLDKNCIHSYNFYYWILIINSWISVFCPCWLCK